MKLYILKNRIRSLVNSRKSLVDDIENEDIVTGLYRENFNISVNLMDDPLYQYGLLSFTLLNRYSAKNEGYIQIPGYPKLFVKFLDKGLYEEIITVMNTQNPDIKLQQLRKSL